MTAPSPILIGAKIGLAADDNATTQEKILAFEVSIGCRLSIDHCSCAWGSPGSGPVAFPNVARVNWNAGYGRALVLTWINTFDLRRKDAGGPSAADIIAGVYDPMIVAGAQALVSRVPGKTLVIALFPELATAGDNQDFYGVPGGITALNQDALGAVFVAAWRHVVDLCRAQGLTDVVWSFVLSQPQISNAGVYTNKWEPFYPGDAYVDQFSLDHHQKDPDTALSFADDLDFPVFYATMAGKGKLISWSSTAANSNPALNPDPQVVWWQTLHAYLQAKGPAVSSLVAWNMNGAGGPSYLLTGAGLAAYATMALDPNFAVQLGGPFSGVLGSFVEIAPPQYLETQDGQPLQI